MKHAIPKTGLTLLALLWLSCVALLAQPTLDLTAHAPTSVPAGSTFEWRTGPVPTSALVSTPTSVSAGLYYGFFRDATGCYSQGAPLKYIVVGCGLPTTDLTASVVTPPAGQTLSFHSGLPVSDANALSGTAITQAGAGTYYVATRSVVNGNACYSEASPVVVKATSAAPVGGTVGYGGGVLCSVSNAGTVSLTGLTGTVIGWETSVNGGFSWTALGGTSGQTSYAFMNAQNGQQYRAVVNNGGGCADAFSLPVTLSTSVGACASDCTVRPGTLLK
jgi:hypothetical protein